MSIVSKATNEEYRAGWEQTFAKSTCAKSTCEHASKERVWKTKHTYYEKCHDCGEVLSKKVSVLGHE